MICGIVITAAAAVVLYLKRDWVKVKISEIKSKWFSWGS